MTRNSDGEGELRTLSLLERLRAEASELWGTSSQLYRRVDALLREIANPNLRDIPTNLPFRVELFLRILSSITDAAQRSITSLTCAAPRRICARCGAGG